MQCLIIAAGKGSRLAHRISPKCLNPVAGVPILERIIRTVADCGIRDFVVVTGYRAGKIRSAFADGGDLGVSIGYADNREWERANGVSVLAAEEVLDGPFILTMSDHLFESRTLRRLLRNAPGPGGAVLAVDRRVNDHPWVDLDDVTKVRTRGDRVTDIGKDLAAYDAFDTGLFYGTPALLEAIRESTEETGDDSLSGGVRRLARQGRMRVVDIGDGFWIDVDDENAFLKAEAHYRRPEEFDETGLSGTGIRGKA